MSGVIDDAGLSLDDLSDTLQCPHVGRIAAGERTLGEPALDAPQLRLVEVRQTSRPPGAAQCADATGAPVAMPPAHALARHLEFARHVRLTLTPVEHLGRLFTPPLHGIEIAWDAGTDRRHDQQRSARTRNMPTVSHNNALLSPYYANLFKFPMSKERASHMAFPTLEEVVEQLREIAEDDTIGPGSVITSLEIDSLDLMEWVFEIEGQAETRIDDALYSKKSLESTTVGDFYERVKSASS